jgi:hypothetical protein
VVYCRGLPPESWRKVSEKGACVNQNLVWEATYSTMSRLFNELELSADASFGRILEEFPRRPSLFVRSDGYEYSKHMTG